jgi:hypothetical protein
MVHEGSLPDLRQGKVTRLTYERHPPARQQPLPHRTPLTEEQPSASHACVPWAVSLVESSMGRFRMRTPPFSLNKEKKWNM